MIIFDTEQRSNFSPPRRSKNRRHHGGRLDDIAIESFISDYVRQKAEADKKKDDKKSETKGPSAAGLGMLLFLLTPVTGPLYIYFTLHMLQASLEILKNLPIK